MAAVNMRSPHDSFKQLEGDARWEPINARALATLVA